MTKRKYHYEYEIIQAYTMKDLIKTINNFINASGFELAGGVAVTMSTGGAVYCQAIMKKTLAKASAASAKSPSDQAAD